MNTITLRSAIEADIQQIRDIYAFEVEEGTASFELDPPSTGEMLSRYHRLRQLDLPYLVAIAADSGHVAGYAYAGPYRSRPAYRHSLENSVYVARWARGQRVGSRLLEELLTLCREGPWQQMVAVIGDSDNVGSIKLHQKAGFRDVGVLRNVGFKHGRWLDTVLMQYDLGQSSG